MASSAPTARRVAPELPPIASRRRVFGFRAALVFAGLLPVMWGASSALGALGGGTHLVHDLVGAGVLLGVLWLAPLVAMWKVRRLPGALACYLAFVAAGVAAAALSGSNGVVAVVLVVQAALVALLHPDRRKALRTPVVVGPLLLPAALLTTAALTSYAVSQAGLQASGDAHAVVAHYFDQAWYALAVGLLTVVAALRGDLRWFAGTAGGLALTAFGAVSVALPQVSSSLGVRWGFAALVAGLGIVALAVVDSRRLPSAATAPAPVAT